MAVVSGGRSTLNPDAPLFIPAAVRQVEDFSPEWWELVKTSTWFSNYWLNQHEEEEEFDCNADGDVDGSDIANLLPESFDLGIGEEFPNLEAQLEELVQSSEKEAALLLALEKERLPNGYLFALEKERLPNGLEVNAEAMLKSLTLMKSPKERSPKSLKEPAKYREKPAQCVSTKCSPLRIHQPR
ncbi:hypothetical protein HHK36_017238 [Tetracentron sinense]|uniref:Uncharacterized protein n=1 Tax=Tetracentron sinense TaxID=13715 RepID=A0A835DCM9_TETSI|nr:hypothetical protein HHK36_017238 [Tetracentron sinense]